MKERKLTIQQNRIPSDPWLFEKGIKCYTTSFSVRRSRVLLFPFIYIVARNAVEFVVCTRLFDICFPSIVCEHVRVRVRVCVSVSVCIMYRIYIVFNCNRHLFIRSSTILNYT